MFGAVKHDTVKQQTSVVDDKTQQQVQPIVVHKSDAMLMFPEFVCFFSFIVELVQ
jgi:hypothetical protein